jgi:superfamily II DNA/RNA helicase
MDQRSRTAVLDRFRKKELKLLIASDVAARGLDIPAVSHVFNFDVPSHAEDYVHRIGRTGRAGRSGTSVTLATPLDSKYVAAIERLTGETVERRKLATERKETATERPRATHEAKPSGSRSESRNGRRDRRGQSAQGSDSHPPAASKEDRPTRAPDRSGPRPKGERHRDKRDRDDDRPIVGMGDHVPQFMLRPVRLPS